MADCGHIRCEPYPVCQLAGPLPEAAGRFLAAMIDPEYPPGPPWVHTYRPDYEPERPGWFRSLLRRIGWGKR